MRPRLVSRRLLANGCHLHAKRRGVRLFASQRITLAVPPQTPKKEVLDTLAEHVHSRYRDGPVARGSNGANHGAAILASRDFAKWFDDQSFMSELLSTLSQPFNPSSSSSDGTLDVLCAVTDGIGGLNLAREPQPGFSTLYGLTTDILPGLWKKAEGDNPAISQDRASSVSFHLNSLARDTRPLQVTLPLANTIFQNGKRSTLLASKWLRDPQSPENLTPSIEVEKSNQLINIPSNIADHMLPYLPLIPLTPPRKILAGLGNIVRQVEVAGAPSPASQELEQIIPKLLDVRSKRHGSSSYGPVGVWCWVIPPHVLESGDMAKLKTFHADLPSEEELHHDTRHHFSRLLSSGCRLHKILSGGGGWGLKQGLLSLDPETAYASPEQDDVEMFIRSFEQRNSTNPSSGIVTPGSYLLFCTEAYIKNKNLDTMMAMNPEISLGVAAPTEDDVASTHDPEPMKLFGGHFGATSASGLYLKTLPEATNIGQGEESHETGDSFTTKVDVPGAWLLGQES